MDILELSQRPDLVQDAIDYFWKCWGSETNYPFYRDCMEHSLDPEKALPKFYIVLKAEKIIATYALLVNDVISRQDLMPWLACLYVDEGHRNQSIAGALLTHALREAKQKGFEQLYLSSDLVNFYEKKGWRHFCKGNNVFGKEIKIYRKQTS